MILVYKPFCALLALLVLTLSGGAHSLGHLRKVWMHQYVQVLPFVFI